MGWLSSIRKGIKKVAKSISKAVNKTTDAIADIVETIGNGVGDGLNWLGERIPGIGGALSWLGDVVSGATDFLSALIKGAGAILGGALSGIIRIGGGILTLDWDGIVGGFGDILGGLFGAALTIVGKGAALVQVFVGIGRPRALNDDELRIIRLVFESSIATYNVRVVDGFAGVYSINGRPFVLGDTIYMKDHVAAKEPGVFAHECVHVWQNQHVGSAYTAEALASQWWGAGYKWEKEADSGKEWEDFEREAQGESVLDIHRSAGTAAGVTGGGSFFAEAEEAKRVFVFKGKDRTQLGNKAVRVIRGYASWRPSEIFS